MRLRTSDPRRPGIMRTRHGRGFRYTDADGSAVRNRADLERIRALVIPPAWTQVWICPWANGHIQALGTDAAGRRQYLYHPQFRAQQDAAKHEHVLDLAARLPDLRTRVEADLQERGLTRDRVLGCAVRLLDLGFFRIGSDSYARENGSYGLTTLLREHVTCRRGEVEFDFPAKSGKQRVQALTDEVTCRVVTALRRRRSGGDRLLAYWRQGAWHEVHGQELNDRLKELTGLEVSAKDFRTWHATVLAAVGLAVSEQMADRAPSLRKRAEARAVREVADYLGNTPAVCRASYINPRLFELYEEGHTISAALPALGSDAQYGLPGTQGRVEAAVRDLLR